MHSDACELFMSEFPELFFPAPVLITSGEGSIGFLSYWSKVNWNNFRVLLAMETCMFETKRRANLTLLKSHFNPNYRLSHVFPSRRWCRTVCAGPLQTAERTNNTSGLKFTGLSLITGTRAASLLQKVRRRLTWRSPKWSSKRIFVFLLRPLWLMPNFDRSTAWYL